MTTSGGIAGLTGYDVQSTVILELMLTAFADGQPASTLRPEGRDDLEISWTDPVTGAHRKRFVQIKKATDNQPDAQWSMAEVAGELLGPAVSKLANNDSEQVWILGDRLADDVERLLAAGGDAPQTERTAYLTALHRLAKADSQVTRETKDKAAKYAQDRFVPAAHGLRPLDDDIAAMLADFTALASGVRAGLLDEYRRRVHELNPILPNVLERVEAESFFGREAEIATRVRAELVTRFNLDPESVRSVIFRNLRGFISDVSKEPGRTIVRADFEDELVSVWPRWVATGTPRSLDAEHLERPELVAKLVEPVLACEVLGPSGSGKSSLTSETYSHLIRAMPAAVVLAAEVRSTTALRDVLIGVAHSLHRRGIPQAIGPALGLKDNDTQTIRNVADALRDVARPVFLLIDVADRTASLEFQRDLAVLLRTLHDSNIHVITFSQASVYRELSEVDRISLGIRRHSMPGLHLGEFSSMVGRRHPGIDQAAVSELFQKVTAGLPSGLLPNLAIELARSKSIDEMWTSAGKAPEQWLTAAHEARFYSMPLALHSAACRVVCLSIPLTPADVAGLFPNDPIIAAIRGLVEEGLLPAADDQVEMHETVRAGLERLVPAAIARETHAALAGFFERQGLFSAVIHHLERAGRATDARQIARQRFIAGHDWLQLAGYVVEHACVTADELTEFLILGGKPNDWLLPDLLAQIKAPQTADKLLECLRSNPDRLREDFKWAWRIQDAILKCKPAALTSLVRFVRDLGAARGDRLIDWVLMSARRAGAAADAEFMQWFGSLDVEEKKDLIGFLLVKPELGRLQLAFRFMKQHYVPLRARGSVGSGTAVLDLASRADIDCFLAALPTAEPAQMLTARAALLDPFGEFIWNSRPQLRDRCRDLLAQRTAAPHLLLNAARVLVFLNDADVVSLVRSASSAEGPFETFAWMVPIVMNAKGELPRLEEIVTSSTATSSDRAAAVVACSLLGADVGGLLAKAIAAKPEDKRAVEFILMIQAVTWPFPEAVGLLDAALDRNDEKLHSSIATAVLQVAGAGYPGADDLAIKGLRSPSAHMIEVSLAALSRLRSPKALEHVLLLAEKLEDPAMRGLALAAAMGSGPKSLGSLARVWSRGDDPHNWLWVLAGRLRDSSAGPTLVTVANDAAQPWMFRRIAILAAARLPFSAALESIAPFVLASTVTLQDPSINLINHQLLAFVIGVLRESELLGWFRSGREGFIEESKSIYEQVTKKREGVLPTVTALGWLWDRLQVHRFGSVVGARNRVDAELHLPLLQAAAVRGLRLQGQRAMLIDLFEQSASEWLRARIFAELCRGAVWTAEEEQRIQVAIAPLSGMLRRIVDDYSAGRPRGQRLPTQPRPVVSPNTIDVLRVTFDEARRFMRSAEQLAAKPLILDLDAAQVQQLAAELDPQLDTQWLRPTRQGPMRITLSGSSFSLEGIAVKPVRTNYEQRRILRPALVAANKFGVAIPWHRRLLSIDLQETYVDQLFAAYRGWNDRERVLRELQTNGDILIPMLHGGQRAANLKPLIDERALPILTAHLQAGHGAFFHSICGLICQIETPAVRPALASAFRRWLVLLDVHMSREVRSPDDPDWIPVWQSFTRLKSHPQFHSVPQRAQRLLEVLLRYPLESWHREDFHRLLVDEPAAYVEFETATFRSEVFEHFRRDQLDEYDNAADSLFGRTRAVLDATASPPSVLVL